jgi:hypothetical protein
MSAVANAPLLQLTQANLGRGTLVEHWTSVQHTLYARFGFDDGRHSGFTRH